MDDWNEKLNALLSNPQLMQQIMSIAQAANNPSSQPQPAVPKGPPSPTGFDPAMISQIGQWMERTGMDANEKALLRALSPYVGQQKVQKLERAMRAARLAGMASGFLSHNKP